MSDENIVDRILVRMDGVTSPENHPRWEQWLRERTRLLGLVDHATRESMENDEVIGFFGWLSALEARNQ